MRRHGWGGDPPADDEAARRRILEATARCIDRKGPARTTLSDVAAELGVIRQTIYRYFPSTETLFAAVGVAAVEKLRLDLDALFSPLNDPVEVAVEATAHVLERISEEPHLTLLLVSGRTEQFAQSLTSAAGITSFAAVLRSSRIDWDALGYDELQFSGLVELLLRLIQSMVITPPVPARSGVELRAFLRRWVGPSICATRALS